jgi:hypothetical protein
MTSVPKSQPIYAGGRVVGEVTSAVFCKSIQGSKHILRTPPAIALDVDSIRQAVRAGAKTIRITDRENGKVYACDVAHFDLYSFELNRGYGVQRALPIDHWTVTAGRKKNTLLPIAQPTTQRARNPIQAEMFK